MRKERISIVFIFYIGNICCFLRTHYSHILIIISDTFILQLDGVFVLTHYGITFFIMLIFYTTLSLISSIEFLFIPIEFDSARTIESIDRSLAPTFVYMQYFPIFWAYINDSVVYFFFFIIDELQLNGWHTFSFNSNIWRESQFNSRMELEITKAGTEYATNTAIRFDAEISFLLN